MFAIDQSAEFSAILEATAAMGEKTSMAVSNAIKALTTNAISLADHTRQIEKEVDTCMTAIEKDCLAILTTRQFDRTQVIFLVNSLRIAVEIERICDYGNQIAKIVQKRLLRQEIAGLSTLHKMVSQMGDTAIKMLNAALLALIRN